MDTTIMPEIYSIPVPPANSCMADRLYPSLPHGLTMLSRTTACTADVWTGQTTPDKAVFYNYTWQVCIGYVLIRPVDVAPAPHWPSPPPRQAAAGKGK